MAAKSRIPTWELPLEQLDSAQWESLCDGCGKCCVEKLEDDEGGGLLFTRIACDFLRSDSPGQVGCSCYENRLDRKPDCIRITPEFLVSHAGWLPHTCAYRLRFEDKPLFSWHPLLSGDQGSVAEAGHSVADGVLLASSENAKTSKQPRSNADYFDALLEDEATDWEPLIFRDWR